MARPKRSRRHVQKRRRVLPYRLRRQLDEFYDLLEDGYVEDARLLLKELQERYPKYVEVWEAQLFLDPNDVLQGAQAVERILEIEPEHPEAMYNRVTAYGLLGGPFLAQEALESFLHRWPHHPMAEEARERLSLMLEAMEEGLQKLLQAFPHLSSERGREIQMLHDRIRYKLALGKYQEAVEDAQQLLRLEEKFTPARNNMATALFQMGRLEEALTQFYHVVEDDPANAYALGFATKILYLLGQDEEAIKYKKRLRETLPSSYDHLLVKMEALAVIGDDEGVLEAFEERSSVSDSPISPAEEGTLYHWAGTAYMRLGEEKRAIALWKRAAAKPMNNAAAQESLDEMHLPLWERHIPWYFTLKMPSMPSVIDDIFRFVEKKKSPSSSQVRRFLERHPYLPRVLAVWLDRGDESARQMAMGTAMFMKDPRLLEVLKTFALGTRGPDHMRSQALAWLMRLGKITSSPLRVWLRGRWQEIAPALYIYELLTESPDPLSPDANTLLEEALDALDQHELNRAEALLRTALTLDPEHPGLLNNLSIVLLAQGRAQEARAVLERLFQRHPDHVLSRTEQALLALHKGDLEAVRAYLKPLEEKKSWHVSDYVAYLKTLAMVALYEGDRERALSLLEIGEGVLASLNMPADLLLKERIEAGDSAQKLLNEFVDPQVSIDSKDTERLALLEKTGFRIGQRVRIKPGTRDPAFPRHSIGGYSGWIVNVGSPKRKGKPPLLMIVLDAETSKAIPETHRRELEEAGFDPQRIWLFADEVEPLS